MRYETKRLVIEPFIKEYITDEYLSWFSDPIVTKHNSHGLGSYVREDAEKFLEDSKDDIIFGIFAKTKEHGLTCLNHIGNISLQSWNKINRSAELACVFGEKEYWGKGYATEALEILLEHGFNRMNLHRIWSGTAETNKGMQKVFDKLGFVKEGVFKDGTFLNGKYRDIFCYGLLEDKWRDGEYWKKKLS